ncbi:hypothetical protein, partial [Roseibium sp. RKSG952]|uniref:hypothetical protein n=1 Tax=Roseibium sp. RKSG952 TaxID=2529384 RepID=UPI0012BD55C8
MIAMQYDGLRGYADRAGPQIVKRATRVNFLHVLSIDPNKGSSGLALNIPAGRRNTTFFLQQLKKTRVSEDFKGTCKRTVLLLEFKTLNVFSCITVSFEGSPP